jgi:hypothetical protein
MTNSDYLIGRILILRNFDTVLNFSFSEISTRTTPSLVSVLKKMVEKIVSLDEILIRDFISS